MDSCQDSGNPFAIPDFWRTEHLPQIQDVTTKSPTDCWVLAENGLDLSHDTTEEATECLGYCGGLKLILPDLDHFEYGPLENFEVLDSFSTGLTDDYVDEREPLLENADSIGDVWTSSEIVAQVEAHPGFNSWESFHDGGFKEPRTEFISEQGSVAFDKALVACQTAIRGQSRAQYGAQYGRILQPDPLLMGLSLLGLGRESTLFRYTASHRIFQARIDNGRMSGYTMESFASLVAEFVQHGSKMRHMEEFVHSVYSSSDSVRSLISLANAFNTVMSAIQWEFGEKLTSAHGLLELQSLIRGPSLVLSYMSEMQEKISAARSDEELVSKMYRFLQDMEHKDLGLRQVGFHILTRISEPFLGSLCHWLGIPSGFANGPLNQSSHFPSNEKEISASSHDFQSHFETRSVPDFILNADARIISGVDQGLQLIRSYSPEHPLVKQEELDLSHTCKPTWQFSWQDAERIALKAKDYERRISDTIKEFHVLSVPRSHSRTGSVISPSDSNALESSAEDFQGVLTASIAQIEKSLSGSLTGHSDNDVLAHSAMSYIIPSHQIAMAENGPFAPPLSLLPILSFNPIIYAQSRLVNHACLRLLFKEHQLRLHLSVQHDYSLFGDGIFATQMTHALFDPELQSTQRRKGRSRSGISGLRLGQRETWPPASSELRLALLGILADSFQSEPDARRPFNLQSGFPGQLGFALRNMSEDEIQQCMDPHSIEALDFLRLKYSPPAPLDTIITPSCLDKYDLMFKLLLRSIRMLYVVNQFSHVALRRSSHHQTPDVINRRFRFEAHHIVTTTCSYFFDGVRTNWSMFLQKLDAIENHLDDFDSGDEHGLERLRDFHEMLLERMMFALLLRKRQEQVMKLLEEIFNCVLVFARLSNTHGTTAQCADQEVVANIAHEIRDVYARFKKKVRLFLEQCRALSEQRGLGVHGQHCYEEFEREDRGDSRGNTMAQLVLRLEMNGYYSPRGEGLS